MHKFIEEILMNGIANQCNYFEFTLCGNQQEHIDNCLTVFDTSLTKNDFYHCMCKLMNKNYKYVQKNYKEIIIGSTQYQNHKNEDTYVCDLRTIHVDCWKDTIVATGHVKNKLTILSVPSTRNYHTESWVKKLTFNITNRIAVHFINGMNTSKFYKVSVVYNHEKNVDTAYVVKSLHNVLKLIAEPTSE